MDSRSHIIPLFLAIVITVIAVWSGFNPTDRAVWYAEVAPIFVVFGLLIITYPKFQFSSLAYFLMLLWLIMHLIGAKYTFANVPFDWANKFLTPLLGEDRNHFDRVAQLSVFIATQWQNGYCVNVNVPLALLSFSRYFLLCQLRQPMKLLSGNMR